MVRLAGIEPATSGSTIRRSNQLSYNRTQAGTLQGRHGKAAASVGAVNRVKRRGIQGKRNGRREEVPAFSVTRPAGGGAGHTPARQREEETTLRVTLAPARPGHTQQGAIRRP